MSRIIIILAVIGVALLIWYRLSRVSQDRRKNLVFWTVAGVIIGSLVLLAATGRMHWLYALGGGIAALIPRLSGVIRYLPLINRFRQQYRQNSSQQSGRQQQRPRSGRMSAEEAREILGLKPGATREEINLAHKRMMQKVHPDRGGSDYLAKQINEARDTLLG
jgi:hypothetical protein